MHRRTVALALVAAAVPALLTACSTEQKQAPASTSLPSAASMPAAPSPSAPTTKVAPSAAPRQAFEVTTRTLALRRGADRPLPTSVWAPRGDGPFPLILFSHGLGGRPSDYRAILAAWARAGFVVAAPAYPHTSGGVAEFNVLDVINQPADASYVITQVIGELGGLVDRGRIGAAGHSAGGITTIGLFSGNRDERLRAGVVLAGRQVLPAPFAGPEAPMLFVHGRKDPTVAYADGRAAFDAVRWPKAFLSVTGGGHVVTGRAAEVVTTTTADFLRWSLYGDDAARARLANDATRGKLATFQDRLG
ncbi:alpha/beta hydrolase family protein [Actinoplanes sp. URMC 104]|uniref:alpha/beta hydrolase family protein n=1 Tax=Actinoplanes sp. URMC 104 TaxID=3423409 RepID=UPI003F1D92FD